MLVPGRRLNRYGLRSPEAQTFERLAEASLFQNGLLARPAPLVETWSSFPASRSRFCARSALSSTKLKWAPSPTATNMVPSAANLTLPIEWEGLSEGRQSAPTGKVLHELPTAVPRIAT